MSRITTSVEGTRIYFAGNTYPVKDQIKSMGGHWDGDRKQWWVGAAKRTAAENLAGEIGEVKTDYQPEPVNRSTKLLGKARYKGRTYYVVAEGRERYRLTVLDGAIDFWALKDQCEWLKTYSEKTFGSGRYARTHTTTLGSIQDFIAESRDAEKAISEGDIPDGYCVDMEDGMVKRRSECDMPQD